VTPALVELAWGCYPGGRVQSQGRRQMPSDPRLQPLHVTVPVRHVTPSRGQREAAAPNRIAPGRAPSAGTVTEVAADDTDGSRTGQFDSSPQLEARSRGSERMLGSPFGWSVSAGMAAASRARVALPAKRDNSAATLGRVGGWAASRMRVEHAGGAFGRKPFREAGAPRVREGEMSGRAPSGRARAAPRASPPLLRGALRSRPARDRARRRRGESHRRHAPL
jgi:hypothetical protein